MDWCVVLTRTSIISGTTLTFSIINLFCTFSDSLLSQCAFSFDITLFSALGLLLIFLNSN